MERYPKEDLIDFNEQFLHEMKTKYTTQYFTEFSVADSEIEFKEGVILHYLDELLSFIMGRLMIREEDFKYLCKSISSDSFLHEWLFSVKGGYEKFDYEEDGNSILFNKNTFFKPPIYSIDSTYLRRVIDRMDGILDMALEKNICEKCKRRFF